MYAMDVLNFHRRVIDQDANGQCQAAQSHNIDGLADHVQSQHGKTDRERDGRGYH